MGLVNTVVPLEDLEVETVQWCREMLELSPFALRLLKASFNATEDGLSRHPAARPRHEPPLLRQRGGAGRPGRLPGEAQAGLRQVPAPPVSHLRLWLVAARARARCPPRSRPVLVGTALAAERGRLQAAALRGRARRQHLHPDRDEPRERLLGRAPRRRHRGPARPGARDRRRPDAAAARARRDVGRVRHRGRGRRIPRRRRRLGAARGRRPLDRRGRALHRRAAPVRLRGPRRAVRLRLLRPGRRRRLVLRPDRGPALGGRRARRARRAARGGDPRGEQRARHRDRPPRRQADARRAARARARRARVRGDARARVRRGPDHRDRRRHRGVDPARASRDAARRPAGADARHAPRRARAQPTPGRHRPPARRLLAPALHRPAVSS